MAPLTHPGAGAGQTLPRYAGKGFALDCLSTTMKTPFEKAYGYLAVKSGTITCQPGCAGLHGCQRGATIAAVLVVLHLALLLLPLAVLMDLTARPVKARAQLGSRAALLVGMAVFALASFGEISLHIHDNWLYLGLIPSFYQAVFYGGLTAGQALLAWGVGGFDALVFIAMLLSGAVPAALILATFATADAPALASSVGGALPGWAVWAVVFGCLFVASVIFFIKAHKGFVTAAATNWLFTVAVALAYIFGIVFSTQVSSTGNQFYHIPTAGCFTLGFIFQVTWLYTGMFGSRSSKVQGKGE